MDRVSLEALRKLATLDVRPRLTLRMPTNPGSPKGMQDAIRLRDLADEGERQLVEAGMRAPAARTLVEQVRRLPATPEFWQARNESLAVFLAEDVFFAWRLSRPLDESVTVGPRFLVKPLLAHLLSDRSFLLLALSRQSATLYRGSRDSFDEVPIPGMPDTLATTLNIDSTERGEQVRSIRRGQGGKEDAIFHGQGGKPDTRKTQFERYLIEVQRALQPVLKNEKDPLLLAGVDYELAMFRKLCSYGNLLPTQLDGSPDRLNAHVLHARAWELLEASRVDALQERVLDRYRSVAGNGNTSRELRDIVPAALRGDLELLWVDRQRVRWGTWDRATEVVSVHEQRQPMDEELLDLAALGTYLAGGMLFVLPADQIPDPSGIAAVYRPGRILRSVEEPRLPTV